MMDRYSGRTHAREICHYRVSSVSFLTYTGQQVARNSCCCVTNAETFDSLQHPSSGGLYDSALGPTDQYGQCPTCGLSSNQCPGHFGHISLPLPLYHPLFFNTTYQLLRYSCWCCQHLLTTRHRVRLLRGQLEMLQRGLISRVSDLESLKGNLAIDGELNGDVVEIQESTTGTSEVVTYKFISKSSSNEIDQNVGTVKTKHVWELQRQLISQFFKECSVSKCPNCSAPVRPIRQEHHAKVFMKPLSQKLSEVYATMWSNHHEKSEVNNVHRDTVAEDCLKQKYVTPLEAQQHLRAVFANEWSLLHLMFGNINFAENQLSPADTFFLDVMVVPPSRYRPVSCSNNTRCTGLAL